MRKRTFLLPILLAIPLIGPSCNKSSNEYSVSLKSNYISINVSKIEKDQKLNAILEIKEQYKTTKKMPDTIDVKINGTVLDSSKYTYTTVGTSFSTLTIPKDYINGDIAITAEGVQIVYDFNTETSSGDDKLIYDKSSGQINAGEDLVLQVSTITSSETKPTGKYYYVPDYFDVYIGDSKYPLLSGFEVEFVEGSYLTKAKLTIKKEVITGNVTIKTNAECSEYYHVYSYGMNVDIQYLEIEEYILKDVDFDAYMTVPSGKVLPTKDDISIQIGDTWIKDSDYIYNVETLDEVSFVHITIPKAKINGTILVLAKDHGSNLFQEFSFESISALSKAGYAKYLFEIGQTKTFKLTEGSGITDKELEVRIIDFDHENGYTKEGGITLEFTVGISRSYFNKYPYETNTYKSNDFNSYIYTYLNTTLYEALPFKKYINVVKKPTMIGGKGSAVSKDVYESYNYLFPLSLVETDPSYKTVDYYKQEGTTYKYYEQEGATHIKKDYTTEGGNAIRYWLRTPDVDYGETPGDFNIVYTEQNNVYYSSPLTDSVYVSPAFAL